MEAELEKNNLEIQGEKEFIDDLASFFDLLAKFDYQDKQKEKLELNSGILVSAPRKSELDSNFKN